MMLAVQTDIFVGRRQELERLKEAVRKRQSLLIWGAPDSGKSELVVRAIRALSRTMSGSCFHLSIPESPQELLREHLTRLFEAGDSLIRSKYESEASTSRSFQIWVRKQSSLRLRGLLYRCASEGQYWFFWDDVSLLGYVHARILKELMGIRKTPIYLIGRGTSETEIGQAAHLFWHDGMRLRTGPLRPAEAQRLLELCIERFALSQLELTKFREEVLKFSGLLPGAIVKMCAMAAQPKYHFRNQIKTKVIYVDYISQNSSLAKDDLVHHAD